MAVGLQASLLVRHAPTAVADAYVRARLAERPGMVFGTLPADAEFDAIIDRAAPVAD